MSDPSRSPEESAALFVKILSDGGALVAHPDTLAQLDANMFARLMVPALFRCRRVPNQYVEEGYLYACKVPALDEFPMPFLVQEPLEPITFKERVRWMARTRTTFMEAV